ncbi:oleate hydratase (plasmid) [Frondihabitans sp. PAMC 28766]|uniref:oleate hydratase n=1 Tax=Frondihabitans sp. PAMC 28766 TaxID=1795630 RepID=UPI00078E78C9|nr:oleate hydratase [Frondihabitans sp. PAMC 28766]AMM22698.1 oleate hydratase [Frondihabitans sp. PAMC 28766]
MTAHDNSRTASGKHLWIVGGGIAGMAAAAFAIRDAGVAGSNVHILEESGLPGGSLDGAKSPTLTDGWVTRGGRMLEDEAYLCTWDLFSSIPSQGNPQVSVRDEITAFNKHVPTHANARLFGRDHTILPAADYGFDTRDRLELGRLIASPESTLADKRIDQMFGKHFFSTNFWQMWRTTFAFQNWHSAIELRRYFLRFVQEFSRINTLSGVRRTVYDQYDSMVLPLHLWLGLHDVDFRFGQRVVDAAFTNGVDRRIARLSVETDQGHADIDLGDDDIALLTLGSITSDSTYGGQDTPPELIRSHRDHGWSLWETVAQKAPDFGHPEVFLNVDENKWESFTLTMHDSVLLDRIVNLADNKPGTGALMTWVDSGWLMSIVVPHQPHFPHLPAGDSTLWGYGLLVDKLGDHVPKTMAASSGREILTELIGQLEFDSILDHVLETTDVTTVMMPYASAVFSPRAPGDRPLVIPDGSTNFGFLGQFTEIPEDVVFTVEYSIHGAMQAVYTLLDVDRAIPGIYHGAFHPSVDLHAIESAFK